MNCLLSVLLVFSVLACQKDPGASSAAVTKTTVTFATDRYVNGSLKPFALAAGDKVTLMHPASGEVSTATPITPGTAASSFLFNLTKPAKGDVVVGYWPFGEKVTAAGSAITFPFPSQQNGTDRKSFYLGSMRCSGASEHFMTLRPMSSLVLAQVQKGAYTVKTAVLTAPGIAGTMTYDPATGSMKGSADAITVTLASPLDCSSEAQVVPVLVPPMTLPEGFTITFTLSDGNTSKFSTTERVTFEPGGTYSTDPASSGRQLLACGSGKVYLIDEKIASAAGTYESALLWTWTASAHSSEVGQTLRADDHIDDCKPVDGNKNILLTSSHGWAALVDLATGKVLWSATGITNAHSAEVLPGGLIAVAVSTGVDAVKLYSRKTSNVEIGSYPLNSAHGVVWSDKTQRLYAIGGTTIQIYQLLNADTSAPSLKLERTVATGGYVSGLHDMTAVDENTLVLAGNKAALLNLTTLQFTQLTHFNGFAGIKSLNYNPSTGEAYYTYGWEGHSEGSYDWSTHTIRYTNDVFANDGGVDKKTIKVSDINMYKARVFRW